MLLQAVQLCCLGLHAVLGRATEGLSVMENLLHLKTIISWHTQGGFHVISFSCLQFIVLEHVLKWRDELGAPQHALISPLMLNGGRTASSGGTSVTTRQLKLGELHPALVKGDQTAVISSYSPFLPSVQLVSDPSYLQWLIAFLSPLNTSVNYLSGLLCSFHPPGTHGFSGRRVFVARSCYCSIFSSAAIPQLLLFSAGERPEATNFRVGWLYWLRRLSLPQPIYFFSLICIKIYIFF